MEEFTVELGGVPIGIRCAYPQNRRFFRDYLSDRRPALTVAPSDADAVRARDAYTQVYGPPTSPVPAWLWENQALHAQVAEGLLSYGALLFHASALSFDGRAFLFTADSGTGKSTHARLWRERFGERVFMLDDDKPLLKVTGAGVDAYGTPWNGKERLGRNASAPVRAIVELRRDSVNHVERCPDAFRTLYRHALRCSAPDLSAQVLRLESVIVERVPFYVLGCNMEPDAAEAALRGIERLEAEG